MSNVFSFMGRIGRDAEIRHMPSGSAILNFSVANNVGYGDNQKTIWLQCSVFGKRAEGSLVDYLKKGVVVFVSGELSEHEYTGNDGIARKSLNVACNIVDLTEKKPDSAEPKLMYQPSQQDRASGRSKPSTDDDYDSQIPF
jgi:single-strand DNA-binding protein